MRLEQARLNLQRYRSLRADGIANQADLDNAETEVRAHRGPPGALRTSRSASPSARWRVRQNDVTDTVILAPFGGVAISKDAQPGEMISPVSAGGGFTRTGICTIVDMSSLEIEVDVNESYINRVSPGAARRGDARRLPGLADPGQGDHDGADGRSAEGHGARADRVRQPARPAASCPDMGIKVAFLGAETPAAVGGAPPVTIAEERACAPTAGSQVVFVVAGDSRVERRALRLGPAKDDRVEVVSGLAPGERIVLDPPAALKDGDRVVVK